MAFIQVMDFRTSRATEIQAAADAWEKATEGKRTVRRRVLCQDRDDPKHYFNIVFFDSYEAAMENSALPETDALSQEFRGLVEGVPAFHDLDVVDDQQ
jgi:hypothetical protein